MISRMTLHLRLGGAGEFATLRRLLEARMPASRRPTASWPRLGALPDGDWLVLTRFDPDAPGQRESTLQRCMVWKLAESYVLARSRRQLLQGGLSAGDRDLVLIVHQDGKAGRAAVTSMRLHPPTKRPSPTNMVGGTDQLMK
jgi:hypothetical protein